LGVKDKRWIHTALFPHNSVYPSINQPTNLDFCRGAAVFVFWINCFYLQGNSEQGPHCPVRVFPALCNSVPVGSSSCQITRFPEVGDRVTGDAII